MEMEAGRTCLSPHPRDINPPKATATARFGATQSPNEKRPLGSYPPTLLPSGLRLVELRGSLTLLRGRKAPGRTEEGGPGVSITLPKSSSHHISTQPQAAETSEPTHLPQHSVTEG